MVEAFMDPEKMAYLLGKDAGTAKGRLRNPWVGRAITGSEAAREE